MHEGPRSNSNFLQEWLALYFAKFKTFKNFAQSNSQNRQNRRVALIFRNCWRERKMSKASQPLFFTNNGPSRILEFRFSQLVLSHLSPADGDILQAAQQNRPHNIKNLSDPIKEAMLAITWPEAAGPLGIPFDAASSKPRVTLDHLKKSGGENAITWTLIHRSYLPPDTQGVNSKCKTGDRIVFDSMIGAPYLQGDHRSANPKGAIDFACSLNCRDLVWIDSQFCFVSDAYVWDKQYLAQIRKQSQDRLIYGRPLPGLEPFTYKSRRMVMLFFVFILVEIICHAGCSIILGQQN